MLTNNYTTNLMLVLAFIGLAIAKSDGSHPTNPGPTCGAPFCGRGAMAAHTVTPVSVSIPAPIVEGLETNGEDKRHSD